MRAAFVALLGLAGLLATPCLAAKDDAGELPALGRSCPFGKGAWPKATRAAASAGRRASSQVEQEDSNDSFPLDYLYQDVGVGSCLETQYLTQGGNPILYADGPPVSDLAKNDVSVTLLASGVSNLDEATGKLSLYVFVHLSWMDCRWEQALKKGWDTLCAPSQKGETPRAKAAPHKNFCNILRSDEEVALHYMGQLWGIEGSWTSKFSRFARMLEAIDPVTFRDPPTETWSPVPQELMPASDTSRSITKGGAWLRKVPEIPGLFEAGHMDNVPLTFDVKLDMTMYPFDNQTFALCLPFDLFTLPVVGEPMNPAEVEVLMRFAIKPTDLSPWIGQTVVDDMQKMGFIIEEADVRASKEGWTRKICLDLKVSRMTPIVILRLFGPLFLLLLIPQFSFWLPIGMVMPRVAGSLLIFLTMNVFRGSAYSMMPKKSSGLLWLDMVIFTCYEITILAVITNVVAQCLWKFKSKSAGEFVDKMMRVIMPLVVCVVMGLAFSLGYARVHPAVTLLLVQCIFFATVLILTASVCYYLWYLPAILLRALARDLQDENAKWRDRVDLDSKELRYMFCSIDNDRSGFVDPTELLVALEKHGLRFQSKAERDNFEVSFKAVCHEISADKLDLQQFRKSVPQLLKTFSKVHDAVAEDHPENDGEHETMESPRAQASARLGQARPKMQL